MAQESSQEKSEQPTPKRLRDARKKGQVFKSKEIETAIVLMATFAAIALSQSWMSARFRALMEATFQAVSKADPGLLDLSRLGGLAFLTLVQVSAPVLLVGMLTAAIVGFLQVGPVFSLEPVKPQLKRLNAVENLKNMFKPKSLFELFKNIVKLVVVFLIAYFVVKGILDSFLLTVTADVEGAVRLGGIVVTRFMIRFLIVFLVVAILDLIMQRQDYIKNLKMTKEEVKREYKEDEGDPLIKGQRKQIHMEMAMSDTRQRMKTADAVITNPTHLAVAIQYDKKEMMAPQIVAKGQRLYAEFIKELAKEYDIPIIRNVPLAWALIELEIDDEIPEKLYVAVAGILTFVYKMKEEKQGAEGGIHE